MLVDSSPKRKADFRISDDKYAAQIDTFLSTGRIVLYRGVPRWHTTWGPIAAHQQISSFGTGDFPYFNTRLSRYIPFTADEEVAELAARSKSGMAPKDRIEYVSGYTTDRTFPVGTIIRYEAMLGRDILGFFNYSEVQVLGPISNYKIWQKIFVGTKLCAIFPRYDNDVDTMSTVMPDVPSDQEIREFVREHGSLID